LNQIVVALFILKRMQQQKVVEVKFIRVAWDEAPQRGIWNGNKYDPPQDSHHVLRGRGLDIAHSELEAQIEMLLEKGWTMEGSVTYINPDKVTSLAVGAGWSHLVQKMVKYEVEKSELLPIRRKADSS